MYTNNTHTVCTKRSAECVPPCTAAIGELTVERRGPKLGASPLKGHTARRQRPSQGYTGGSTGGCTFLVAIEPGAASPAQRAHTRRHGEVLTTVAGAHNLTKVVVAWGGGIHKCATAIAATVTTRCPSQQCAADISYFRCLAHWTALSFSLALSLFIFVCVFLSSVLYVHCTCFLLCEL